jgi:prepilin-type N-terminal cleavage/methylation domain-containing protein
MKKREAGFTLIELLITMVIFVLVLSAGSQIFTGLLTQFKQQSKIAETNIEGIVGLEILKQDIEHAGYGLPWVIPTGVTYSEASSSPASTYNDASNPPRAVISGNGTGFNGSDYLVIKAINVATNDTSQKWTTLQASSPYVRTWTPSSENLAADDSVIVLNPGTEINSRTLVVDGTTFSTTYNNVTSSPWPPSDVTEARIVYGIDNTSLRMPFNRADYFVRRFDGSGNNITPQRCAPNTGVLEKATVKQSGGGLTYLPLLDCAAEMQVDFWLDTDADGNINWPPSDDISGLTAQQIREQVKEVRVYIVAHEGQRDVNYDFSMNNTREALSALETLSGNSRTITFVNLKTLLGDPEYKHYRWKLYTIVVKPNNLR